MKTYLIKLSKSSQYELKERFRADTSKWRFHNSGMIIHKSDEHNKVIEDWIKSNLKKHCVLVGYMIGTSSNSVLLRVMTDTPCSEKEKIINFLTKERGEDISNEVINWKYLDEPLLLDGLIIEQ